MYAPSKIYDFHVGNLREIQIALLNISRIARSAIAAADPQKNLRSLVRLYALVLGSWAETRLRKLLHEEAGFSAAERETIVAAETQLGQWKLIVDTAFRKHHKITKGNLTRTTLGVAHFARHQALHEVLDQELKIVIQIRNKLAHGQWVYPLNSDGTKVNSEKYQKINHENLLSLQFKYALLQHLADMAHDLIVNPATFERDFDSHFRKLEQVRQNLKNRKYSKYEKYLTFSRRRRKTCEISTTEQ